MHLPRSICLVIVPLFLVQSGFSRDFRVNRIPNGTVFSCSTCHISPQGGGARNAFGIAVFNAIGGSSLNIPFWTPEFANLDSDGDGYTNGTELGDPDGDFLDLFPPSTVSRPGDATSTPVPSNTAPIFNSSPKTSAFIGENYSYPVQVFDGEGDNVTFTKAAGPEWLEVSPSGLVSGIPPVDADSSYAVSILATDDGSPSESATQNYTLTVSSSFNGWQRIHFNLPTEQELAAPDQDPDNDDLANLVEYFLRTDPRTADDVSLPGTPTLDGGQMVISLEIRDDDSRLAIQLELSNEIAFTAVTLLNPTTSDPNASDGLKTVTFTDPVSSDSLLQRYGRLRFEINP